MEKSKVWFITGASSGIGLEITKAALAAGKKVIATARNAQKMEQSIGLTPDNLLIVSMDITKREDIEWSVKAAVSKFGGIDVLVNNAGNFYAGFFEELSQQQIELQIATNLFGPMKVTRCILPIMRKQRAGHIITISSVAGLVGSELCSAYAASKFGLEGWMESLQIELSPFGINTTLVEPGFFRTSLLENSSTIWAENHIEDYTSRITLLRPQWEGMSGNQWGDASKLAVALMKISGENKPPRRWLAGADAVSAAEGKANELLAQATAYRELSSSLAHE